MDMLGGSTWSRDQGVMLMFLSYDTRSRDPEIESCIRLHSPPPARARAGGGDKHYCVKRL
jgi:hypothetical protein